MDNPVEIHLLKAFRAGTASLTGKINDRIIYGDSLLDAIAMGVMTSMGRAVAASVITARLRRKAIETPCQPAAD